jgi:hypothetical protein
VTALIVRNGQAHSVEMGRSQSSRAFSCDMVDGLYLADKEIQNQAGEYLRSTGVALWLFR